MTKEDNLSLLNNEIIKLYSVKIKHHVDEIIIPNNSKTKRTIFHQKEGLPIKFSIQSFLAISIQCKHKVFHEFKIPVESLIEWKMVNGKSDGSFKHCNGLNTKYLDSDVGTCVIYYPPKDGIKENNNIKEIPISIKIKVDKLSTENVKKFLLNNSVDINYVDLSVYEDQNFLLTLFLKQKKSFIRGISYELSYVIKITVNDKNLENPYDSVISLNNNNNIYSDFIYSCSTEDDQNLYSISKKNTSGCNLCKLFITFKQGYKSSLLTSLPKINIDVNRFFTSESLKISHNYFANKSITENTENLVVFKIRNISQDICEFKIINCPSFKTFETFWTCTAGSFHCGNNGSSVIYNTPQENELNKSPIILSLYQKNIFDTNYEMSSSLIDQKEFWLLRGAVMGG